MKKIIFIFLLIFSISIVFNLNVYASTETEDKKITKELLIEEAFLKTMEGEILNAIEDYYGEVWLYFLPSVTNVTKNEAEGNFDVTVQVVTYQRAIMPPYGLETITFRIPGYKVLNFKHKEIKGEDLPEDKFNPDV